MFAMNRKFRIESVSTAIIAVNVIVFLIFNLLLPHLRTYLVMIKPLALSGDIWRFFTAMFAHADFMHLTLNMLCLYAFGQLSEMFFGKTKFCIIYLLSGLAGTGMSILFSDYSSLGASGAIFGIVAANFYMVTKMTGEMKRRFLSDLGGFVILNIGFSLFDGNVDLSAHIGGLLGGVISGFALGHKNENLLRGTDVLRSASAFLLVFALIIGSFFAKMSTPDHFLTAIVIRHEYYDAANAYALAKKASRAFPDDAGIAEVARILEYMTKHP